MALQQAAFTARARRVRLLLFDVDGVLTDCTVTLGEAGETKTFSIRDGAAIGWAKQCGLEVGFLSGRPSEVTARRAKELGVELVIQSAAPKKESLQQLLTSREMTGDWIAYMGDDLADLSVMALVGLSGAPADADPEAISRAHWVSSRPGGRGAVREFIEAILRARNQWGGIVARNVG
jgi:3-deoxy-D-manno-octulosonate 8-phosphate phosphatase (KDO 8-P phosphatase)